jgi:hypothetical protein
MTRAFGASDQQTATPAFATADDDNFWGKHSAKMEPSEGRWKVTLGGRSSAKW